MIVYISIGNSDDKLTQAEWSQFAALVRDRLNITAARIHGSWFSRPEDPWQNACWCAEFGDEDAMRATKDAMTAIRKKYQQDSVAWAIAETEFI